MVKLIRWLGTLSGIKDGVKVIRQTARITGTMVSGLRKAARTQMATDQPAETFEQAIERLGLSEADLSRRYRQFIGRARFFGGLSVAAFLLLIYQLASGRWTNALAWVGLAPAFGALALRSGFYAWQIRQRRLGELREYWRNHWARWP